MPDFYEFFAGGGMARAGLGPGWTCLLANDMDERKARAYRANWGARELLVRDIADLTAAELPSRADLAWGSFPCQDLSLAGVGAGLNGARSGTFHAFWDLIGALADDGRAPAIVALENVCGALTSHGGGDFAAIAEVFAAHGYRLGPLVIDAADFVPQSRPRLFLIGAREEFDIDPALLSAAPNGPFHPPALERAVARLPRPDRILWWRVPPPARRKVSFGDILESDLSASAWHSAARTARLLALMSPVNFDKVRDAQASGERRIGAVYRRTRTDAAGRRTQRAEVRFDEIAGCLRTPAGGSSRQTILVVKGETIRSRLITARETARLMGLPDDYNLPPGYTDAYHLTGDGVVVDVVRHLARHLIEPLLAGAEMDFSPRRANIGAR
ncbi:MAG: DNA cytosine methyltransferase [Caulobacteraceae bacterium]